MISPFGFLSSIDLNYDLKGSLTIAVIFQSPGCGCEGMHPDSDIL